MRSTRASTSTWRAASMCGRCRRRSRADGSRWPRSMPASGACWRLKERLGLFDDPYRRGSPRPGAGDTRTLERRGLAREAARRSIVLLTHRGGVLPLSPEPEAHRARSGLWRKRRRTCWAPGLPTATRARPCRSPRGCSGAARLPHRSRGRGRNDGDDTSGIAAAVAIAARGRSDHPLPRRGRRR